MGIVIGLIIGGLIGFLIGLGMNFDWEAMFRYKLKSEEMRMKYSMEIIERDSEV